MKEISWDEVRKGDYLIIKQNIPLTGPRKKYLLEWCGRVVEHNPKWTQIEHAGMKMSVPTKYGEEEIFRLAKKDFDKYVKDNYG